MKLLRHRRRLRATSISCLWLLCLCFGAGVLAAVPVCRAVAMDDLTALGSYVTEYAQLGTRARAGLARVIWLYGRYPAAALLLGCTGWGVVLLPVVCGAEGFFLSFAAQCFALSLGQPGVMLALAALGVRCLFSVPCLLAVAEGSFRTALQRAKGQRPERRDRRVLLICVFVLLTGTVAECALVPRLLFWLMPGLS